MKLRTKMLAHGAVGTGATAALAVLVLWGAGSLDAALADRRAACRRVEAVRRLSGAVDEHLHRVALAPADGAQAARGAAVLLAAIEDPDLAGGPCPVGEEWTRLRARVAEAVRQGSGAPPRVGDALRLDREVDDLLDRLQAGARACDQEAARREEAVIGRIRLVAPALGLGALLVAALALLSVLPRLRAALTRLEVGARRMGSGDLTTPIDVPGTDELAAVGRSFDAMAARLRETVVSRDHLEHLVAERTAALEQSRRELADRVAELQAARRILDVSDRLASVGRLSRGLAHELNNPLAALLADLDFLRDELAAAPGAAAGDLLEALDEASTAARRIARIVTDLRAFSREGAEEGAVDLATILAQAERLVGHEVRTRARLQLSVAPGPILVQGPASRLGAAFMHLLLEAASAIPADRPGQGSVSLRARVEGAEALVEIEDDGESMPPDLLEHAFDPFYRPTAGFAVGAAGRGTGLGLASCQGTIRAAGGTIQAEGRAGGGSVFRIRLPLATSGARLALGAAGAAEDRRPRIMVIDDEPLTCASLYRLLSPSFDVVPLTSSRSALALLQAGERFEAILCEPAMAEMPGSELYQAVARLEPGLERTIVFMTGARAPEAQAFLAGVPNPRIAKPLEPEVVLRAVAASRAAANVEARPAP